MKHERGSLLLAPPNLSRQLHAAEESLPSPACPFLGKLTAVTWGFFWDLSHLRCVAAELLLVPRGF